MVLGGGAYERGGFEDADNGGTVDPAPLLPSNLGLTAFKCMA